jgi:tRNA threonylcarbamoyladenosine biosynthesis protein TsaB
MNGCQACICEVHEGARGVQVLAQEKQEITRGQAEHIMPIIERVIEKSEISYSSLDIIGVTNGPGAFTGIRIAIATAKAIALAADKCVIGVSTIGAVLDSYLKQETQLEHLYPFYAVILETKRKDYYFQLFEVEMCKERVSKYSVIHYTTAKVVDASEIAAIISTKEVLLIGDAIERFLSECAQSWPSHVVMMPDGSSVAKLAVNSYQTKGSNDGCDPIYLRGAEIGKAKIIPRLIKT